MKNKLEGKTKGINNEIIPYEIYQIKISNEGKINRMKKLKEKFASLESGKC